MEIIEKVKEREIPAAEYCDKYGYGSGYGYGRRDVNGGVCINGLLINKTRDSRTDRL